MNPPGEIRHSQFSKALEKQGFREFLETTLQITLGYSKGFTIGKTYVEHLQGIEHRLNTDYEAHLQKVKAQFKAEIFELKSLNPDLYRKTKTRYLYVAEQNLLYQEFANKKNSPSAKYFHLKQPDGQFTPNRWLHALLLSQPGIDKEALEAHKTHLLKEHPDIALIKAFLVKTTPKDPFTVFASRAMVHLKKTKCHFEWKKGTLTETLLSDANLSPKEKEVELNRLFVTYLISLTKLYSSKMSKNAPKKPLSDLLSPAELDTTKIDSMDQSIPHLISLSNLSMTSQRELQNESSPKALKLKFFSRIQKSQKLLSDFLVFVKSTEQKDLRQSMSELQISSPDDEPMEIESVNPIKPLTVYFETTKRIFDAIVTHTSLS